MSVLSDTNCETTCLEKLVEEINVCQSYFSCPRRVGNWASESSCACVSLSGYLFCEIHGNGRNSTRFSSQKALLSINSQQCLIPTQCDGNSENGFGCGGCPYWHTDCSWGTLSLHSFYLLRIWSKYIAARVRVVLGWEWSRVHCESCL